MLSKEEEIKAIKEKLKTLNYPEPDKKDMIQFNINPQNIKKEFIVRFRNLSPWLKTIVLFSWVVFIYWSIFFLMGFVVGVFI